MIARIVENGIEVYPEIPPELTGDDSIDWLEVVEVPLEDATGPTAVGEYRLSEDETFVEAIYVEVPEPPPSPYADLRARLEDASTLEELRDATLEILALLGG